jgi:hypothetical protein
MSMMLRDLEWKEQVWEGASFLISTLSELDSEVLMNKFLHGAVF